MVLNHFARFFRVAIAAGVASLSFLSLGAQPAQAQKVIRGATVIGNTGGDSAPQFSINNTINQSGLLTPYVSGVTNFDTYIASNPIHSAAAVGEWFAPDGVLTSTITYDMGAVYMLDRLALWNEETWGIRNMVIRTSIDPSFITNSLVGNYVVFDLGDGDYPPRVYNLTTTDARYVRITVTRIPEPSLIAIGEIAFSTLVVPEASSVILFSVALPLLGGITLALRGNRSALCSPNK